MLLDLRTLILLLSATHFLFALLMLSYWRQRHLDQALAIWSACNLVGAAGWLFIGLRDLVPVWLSIPVGNALLLLAWMLLWAGMRSFANRPANWSLTLAPAATVLLLFLYVPPIRDNLVARIVVVNIGLMICLLAVSRDALRDEKTEPLYARRVIVFALLVAVISNLLRLLLVMDVDPGNSFLAPNWSQELGVFAQAMAVLAWNVGLLLMARERLENELVRAARRDPLTNVLNRGGFRELGDRQVQRSTRAGRPLSAMLMDLDHFKKVNDTYGHEAGDRLLCAFAETARKVMRPTDLLARYGGEEFCALLPDSDLAEALAIAERLRARFESVRITAGDAQVGTTVCIGVVEIHASGETIERALGRADAALYLAKRQGRNRVCEALPAAAPEPAMAT